MRISDWSSDVCSSDLKDVRRTDESAQDLRCVDERRIAGQAAVAVVDRLQVIELDLETCRGRAVAACMASHPPQLGETAAAIGERDRKRVVWGKSGSVRVDLVGTRRLI